MYDLLHAQKTKQNIQVTHTRTNNNEDTDQSHHSDYPQPKCASKIMEIGTMTTYHPAYSSDTTHNSAITMCI